MKILVCVKQVCDSADTLTINDSAEWIVHRTNTVFRMNRYDEYALEEALRIHELLPETMIDVISLGPARVQSTIRRSLGMGAHHGIHVLLEEDRYVTPYQRARIISEVARSRDYDLVFTGVMAEDDMECQVGGMSASLLGYACATGVVLEEISPDASTLRVERELEGGRRECLALRFPAVLTIQSGINIPRYPTLSNMLRARTAELECISEGFAPVHLQHQTFVGLAPNVGSSTGEFIEGTPQAKALRLLDILHEHSLM